MPGRSPEGRSEDDAGAPGLATVRLLSLPVQLAERARIHNEGLMREFTLIRIGDPSAQDVPARLVALAGDLSSRFGAFTESTEAEWAAAEARGDDAVDLVYRVPPEAAEAARALGVLLDEADDYCRAGAHLLTLVTPPDALAFRRWFLDEFVRQTAGEPPLRWRAAPSTS